jgi:UDP-N-acetylmuramyl pentapeptide phosphotransferase/UDP-N-acetylglucosamine-1-phosphate transferase
VPARWALAFSVAAVVALASAAALRWAAHRGVRKVRRRGALAVAAGALAGWLFLPNVPGRLAVVAALALGLAVFAAMFVERVPPRGVRLAVLTAAAIAAVAAGVRLEWAGVGALDVTGTVVLIVAVANALRWSDTADGMAAATTTAVMAGVFALGGFGGQYALAVLAVAVGGACLGFFAYNLPPAAVMLDGDGALFLGFLAAVLAIEVQPSIGAPGDLAVPLLLLALPLLEITLVPLGQLRRRKRLGPGRRDHLTHRLRLLGVSRTTAVAMLAAVQLVLAGIAVFEGRGVLTPVVGLAAGAVIVGAIMVAASVKDVYGGEPVAGFSARVKLAVLGVIAFVVLAAAPAGVATVSARRSVDRARSLVHQGIDAARAGDARAARSRFAAAAAAFDNARGALDNPLASAGLALPVVGPNLRTSRELARIGVDLARTGERTAASVDPDRIQVVDGTVPLDEVRRVTPDLGRGAQELSRAVRRLDGIDQRFLLSPMSEAFDKVDHELSAASREADNAVAAARLAPAIFGGDGGTRHYFLAMQNSAELRATGGFIGNWGILSTDNGKVHLDSVERIALLNPPEGDVRTLNAPKEYVDRYSGFQPAQEWRNINMSPDFPTVARVLADQYHQATGGQVDGVLAVDPQGLAALLKLTGPVPVAGWPEPLTADNIVKVTMSDAYVRFADSPGGRPDFLGDVARAVVDRATAMRLGNPAKIARVLGAAAREGHITLAFERPDEQALARRIEVAGRVPGVRSDSVLVTTQNAAGNKLDYYLRRHVNYGLRLDPVGGGRDARVQGRLDVRLDNTGPDSGLPQYVIGPYDSRFVAGENRSYVSVYTPLAATAAAFDGHPEPVYSGTELGRNVYSAFLSIPARSSRTLAVDVSGSVHLDGDGWYTLALLPQPMVHPDDVTVTLEAPSGWRFAAVRGLKQARSNRATGRFRLDHTAPVRVRLAPATGEVWQRLVDGG